MEFINPVVLVLGQESDMPYVDEAVAFFFALSVVRSVNGQYVSKFLRSMIRLYGALAFVMPLMLNGLPSDMMKNMDDYARMVAIAMVVEIIPFGNIHPMLDSLVDQCCDISYAIMKANACAAGYAAFGAAFGGSIMAPFLGAFVATNGHRFIENGMAAFNIKLKNDNDAKLGVLGGGCLMLCQSQGMSNIMSRATLAFLNVTQNYVPYDDMIKTATGIADNAQSTVTGMFKSGGSSMKKRSRSKTPSMKK